MNFLQRWSRLKSGLQVLPEAAPAPASSGQAAALASTEAPLPALDSLDLSSDFTGFMQANVEEGLRKAALQRLFHGEHFNVMDGLDVYIDDYNGFEPISAELLQNLNQASGLLFEDEQTAEAQAAGAAAGAMEGQAEAPHEPILLPSATISDGKGQG